jgi:peptidyl-prolyl cis-trans isomerase C
MSNTKLNVAISFVVLTLVPACQKSAPADPDAPAIVATVNGTPVNELDVRLKQRLLARNHDRAMSPEEIRRTALEDVIQETLVYQRGAELGIDKDPTYQRRLAPALAQFNAEQRTEMSNAFFRRVVLPKTEPTTADAKKFFDEHAEQMRQDLHVFQILRRGQPAIAEAQQLLAQGKTFEQAAATLFTANLPPSAPAPWDVGWLHWEQVPEQWRPIVYGLKPGDVSPVIAGPKERFWLIKLIERRDNPDATFEKMLPRLLEVMKNQKREATMAAAEKELRAKANIVYMPAATQMPIRQQE